MHRKKFLSVMIPLGASVAVFGKTNIYSAEPDASVPPPLKHGDMIGITAAAGYISPEDCKDAVNTMQAWGFKIKTGNTIGKKDFTYGGTDRERLTDLQQMLDDDSLKAIMCARGGYGLIRIIDQLDFKKFTQKPKWIIGFSDATVLHSHIARNFGIATIHSKMCNSFVDPATADPIQNESIDSIRKCLTGEKMSYTVPANANNKKGTAMAMLTGGNLKTLETLAGTPSDIITKNRMLFVEDTGEYLYSIDRMFWNLKRTGKLKNLAGLIIGGFKVKPDDEGDSFGKTLEQIVLEKVSEYDYPVCFDFPVGHQKNNFALKCGVLHRLDIKDAQASLKEI